MAANKFEENIKQKLEKRTINPSNNAWDNLSNKMDAQESKSNNNLGWWIGIAGSLVGVFLITTLFFKNNEENIGMPTVVETPIEESSKSKNGTQEIEEIVENDGNSSIEKATFQNESKKAIAKQEETSKMVIKKNKILESKSEFLAAKVKEIVTDESKNEINSISIFQEVDKQEIVVQLPEVKETNNQVTDAEIEALLNKAQKDLVVNKTRMEKDEIVDAMSLLQEVETDLEKSFRDKVFNTIISGYKTVKTAVAERND